MNLIVMTDGPETSGRVLPHAAAFSRAAGGRITLLRVMDPAADVEGRTPGERKEKEEDLVRGWEFSMRDEMDRLGVHGGVHVGVLRQGEAVPDAALRIALDSAASLIVLGSRGRSSLREILFGSVAREMLKKARQPVMVVGPQCVGEAMGEDYRVLVAVDGSPSGRHLVGALAPLLASGGARVTLLSVHVPTLGDEGERAGILSLEGHLRDLRDLLPASVEAEGLVRSLHGAKSLVAEIKDATTHVGASAIALFTKTYGGPGEPLVRSTARNTIQASPVPVILVPPRG